jgi:hypothetical protein
MDGMNDTEHDFPGDRRKRLRRFVGGLRNLAPGMDWVIQNPVAKAFARTEKLPRVNPRDFADRFNFPVALSVVVVDLRCVQPIEYAPEMIEAVPVMAAHRSVEGRWDLCRVSRIIERAEQSLSLAQHLFH